jgi:PleD family two-component response regulator
LTSQAQRRLRVLVVGDQHDTVMNVGILLRSEGIEVRTATGARQVPAAVAQFPPDVVLLDRAMPAPSGQAVAQAILKHCGEHKPVLHTVARPIDPDAILKLVLSVKPK